MDLNELDKNAETQNLSIKEKFVPKQEFYIVKEGCIRVLGRKGRESIHLTTLKNGAVIGSEFAHPEIELIAQEPTQLIVVPSHFYQEVGVYKELVAQEKINFEKIYQIAFESLLQRKNMGIFLINLVVFLSLFSLFLPYLRQLVTLHVGTLTSIPLILFVNLLMFLRLYISKLSLSTIGITKKNLKVSLMLGLKVSLALIIVITVSKYLMIRFIPPLSHSHFFYTYGQRMLTAHGIHLTFWQVFGFALLYAFHSVLQELVARGGLQGMFKQFFVFENGRFLAIILASLVFASAHAYYGIQMVLAVFIPGLIWGWIYDRTGNIFGPALSHVLVGTFQFQFIGGF